MMEMKESGGTCGCKHHKVVPVAIILIGLSVLLADWGIFTWQTVDVIWPVLVIVIGASKLCKCCKMS